MTSSFTADMSECYQEKTEAHSAVFRVNNACAVKWQPEIVILRWF